MSWKKSLIIIFLVSLNGVIQAQPFGYYNGTAGKSGDDLKATLNGIIKGHVDYSYYFARDIINYSDADPDNPSNVILFYSQQSRDASLYGTGGGYINREHVWAKSHGYFSGLRPMDGDAFNLRPADGAVNEVRGNKDFDNVQPGGTQYSGAPSCWYTDSTWEPGPLTKGQVARILFYMATRYEGENGEMNLELVSHNNTYPNPVFGNLTTLLEWNNEYPPSDFERRRNERIYQIQQNRNPFIDHPEFANYIWNNQSPSGVLPDNFSMIPDKPSPGEAVQISFSLSSNSEIPDEVNLFWGDAYDSEDNQTAMAANQSVYSADINMPAYQSGEMVYFKVELIEDTTKTVYRASYLLPTPKDELTFTSIKDVQGDGVQTPVKGQVVTVTGRVSSNFDGSFYIQNGSDIRQGICIYGSLQTGKVGDSIVVTGKATEYSNLTEISDVTYLYNFQDNEEITPIEIPITDINEDYEGMLVKIKGIEFEDQGTTIPNSNTSYTFSNSSGSSVVFSKSNSRLVGNKIPTGKVDLVGVVGQYQDTYQILPRDMDDFMLGSGNSILLKAKKDVDIFPNPSSTIININTGWDVEKIVVYDLSGRVMFSNRTGRKTIGVENIQPGIYILEVTLQGGEIIRKKFIRSE